MTTKTHYTTASTWTPPAWVTRYKAIVAGGAGKPGAPYAVATGGLGAIVTALLSVSGAVTVAPGSIAGGLNSGGGLSGGAGSRVAEVYAGGGGGGSIGDGPNVGYPGGDADGSTYQPFPGTAGRIGGPDGSGGLGGSVAATGFSGVDGAAGASHSSGGAGAPGVYVSNGWSGGGGGGYSGGGSGCAFTWPDGSHQGVGGGAGSSAGGTLTGLNDGDPYVDVFIAATPLQPTLASPTNNLYIDRTIDQPLTFISNPASADVLDAQTDAQVDYRLIGAGSWTTIGSLGTGTTATIAANTLAVGSYEWRARTKADGGVGDAMGVWGPYSETGYFRADNPAAAPTATEPTPGAVVAVNSATATWTVATQTAFQMRVVGDNAGAPDAGTIYADSGEVISTDRTKTLTVGVNHVPAHVQVRVRDKTGGVWSAWVSVAVTIEWAPPPVAAVSQIPDPEHGSIVVKISNSPGVGAQPTADTVRVFVTENGIEQRRAILPPSTDWEYWTPVSEIGVRVESVYSPTNVVSTTEVIW